jgi:hypothetical protein
MRSASHHDKQAGDHLVSSAHNVRLLTNLQPGPPGPGHDVEVELAFQIAFGDQVIARGKFVNTNGWVRHGDEALLKDRMRFVFSLYDRSTDQLTFGSKVAAAILNELGKADTQRKAAEVVRKSVAGNRTSISDYIAGKILDRSGNWNELSVSLKELDTATAVLRAYLTVLGPQAGDIIGFAMGPSGKALVDSRDVEEWALCVRMANSQKEKSAKPLATCERRRDESEWLEKESAHSPTFLHAIVRDSDNTLKQGIEAASTTTLAPPELGELIVARRSLEAVFGSSAP